MQVPLPHSLERIAQHLGRLPGVGKRSALRNALAMLKWSDAELADFAGELAHLHERVHKCTECGNLTDGDLCAVCASPSRRRDQLCVVEQASQIQAFEDSGSYNGLYHVLGGRISPLSGVGPDELDIRRLQERLAAGGFTELILATGMDVEGEATAHYIADLLRPTGIALTRLASGIAVGSSLGYADAPTIGRALSGRQPL